MKNFYFLLIGVCFFNISGTATIILVPQNYASIQSAINASASGDTIVVSPGTYVENINFRGKNIFLTSQYYLAKNPLFISTTIIDGSNPLNPDTASCVIFNSGENNSAILQGFTITGGKGTKWLDIHGAGKFREGGGILIELSSPSILHNIIVNNACITGTGLVSAGGGGIRIGDGNPIVCSNLIQNNKAVYGPGIVLNYTGGRITNNVIVSNSGGSSYSGGSGIWAIDNYSLAPLIIENNTVVYNTATQSNGSGGMVIWGCTNIKIKNNIVWGNLPALQLKTIACTPTVTYCDIQGGYAGTGNLNVFPNFQSNNYYLASGSACIDAGDTASAYKDIEDPGNLGFALLPSKGTTRNDMGAYGGPCTADFPVFGTVVSNFDTDLHRSEFLIYPCPAKTKFYLQLDLRDDETLQIGLLDIWGKVLRTYDARGFIAGAQTIELSCAHLPAGIYFLKVFGREVTQAKKLVVEGD